MELTRRDAVAALAALGVGGVTVASVRRRRDSPGTDDRTLETLVAAAEVVYPAAVDGVEAFVETFVRGRLERDEHAAGVEDAVAELDRYADGWYDAPFSALTVADRDATLRTAGVDDVAERPDGTPPERIRYYVVNELLLALYASPTGGELVGIENPQGHPGGLQSYRRGPEP